MSLSSMIFRVALMVAPFLFPALSIFVLPKRVLPTCFIFALSIGLAGSGLLLDRWHFGHLSIERAFDFNYYFTHFLFSFIATGFLLASFPKRLA
jgi:hypothetical protein